MDFKKYILHHLLDKYEASQHFKGKAVINRRVRMHFGERAFPQYWDSDNPHFKTAIHQAVEELVLGGIVSVEWMPFEKGNIIHHVSLNLSCLDQAYLLAARTGKEAIVHSLRERTIDLQGKVSTAWIKNFLSYCLEYLDENKDIPAYLPPDDNDRDLLFSALLGLDRQQGNPILERVFSLKYLGDSKSFQRKVRKRMAAIARAFYTTDQDIDDETLMSELGIEKTTEELLLYGPITFANDSILIDYSGIPFGAIVDTRFSGTLEVADLKTRHIITIENKSNFHYLVARFKPQDVLLIYTGGFPGPKKRELIAKIFAYCEKKPEGFSVFHWGDIDLGGFRIMAVLRKIIPAIKPMFMDVATLYKYKDYCDTISPQYAAQIRKILDKAAYRPYEEVLRLMVEKKIRLEQEALLTQDDLGEEVYQRLAELGSVD